MTDACACARCVDARIRRREFYWMLAVLGIAMLLAHIVGIRICYGHPWAHTLCGTA